jgi:hypothetical protein
MSDPTEAEMREFLAHPNTQGLRWCLLCGRRLEYHVWCDRSGKLPPLRKRRLAFVRCSRCSVVWLPNYPCSEEKPHEYDISR